MNMFRKFVLGLFALSAVLPLQFVASEAQAQSASATPRIDGFDVQPVRQALPGNELVFTLYGSPGGAVAVQIAGAASGVALTETETGVYEGTYTIGRRDKITATSAATANLRLGNRVASMVLDEPLVGRATGRRAAPAARAAAGPKIDRFDVDPPARLVAGEELMLTLTGTPGGTANARIAGVKGKLVLSEVRAGVYEGTHTIKNRDRVLAGSEVVGTLRVGDKETTSVLAQSLIAKPGYQSSVRQAAKVCVNCGTVEAINVVEVKGDGTYIGKIAGGLAGVLLGSQVGSGRGTTVAQVAGAVGGAYAGNEVEARMKSTKHYEVLVRLDNGGSQTFTYEAQPAFAQGAKVKVENGALVVVQ